jgi:hypothetical protein
MPSVGYVTFRCKDPATILTVRLGADRPDVSAGYGGWEEVERPRRVSVVTWQGLALKRMSIPVLFDNFADGRGAPVENDIARLEALALPFKGGPPPSVRFEVTGRHVPNQDVTWVIEDIDWGDGLMNNEGNRTRQAATVNLIQFVSDELITENAPGNAHAAKTKAKRKSKGGKDHGARVKRHPASRGKKSKAHHLRAPVTDAFEGEDLLSIAARELGDSQRWREIAELNGIRDPRAIHVGQVLRLP